MVRNFNDCITKIIYYFFNYNGIVFFFNEKKEK